MLLRVCRQIAQAGGLGPTLVPTTTAVVCPRMFQIRNSSSAADIEKSLENINGLFVEARDEIEYANEDLETVYFNESFKEAKERVHSCLDAYKDLLDSFGDDEQGRGKIERSMGMKMEQLKAELDLLDKHLLE